MLNDVFMPSDDEFREAQNIIAVAEKARQNGASVATLNNKMIDAPIVAQAQAVLARRLRYSGQPS